MKNTIAYYLTNHMKHLLSFLIALLPIHLTLMATHEVDTCLSTDTKITWFPDKENAEKFCNSRRNKHQHY